LKTLPELIKEYHELENILSDNGGEITTELEAMLDAHDVGFEEKKDRYIGLIRHMEASIDEFKAVQDQAVKRIKTLNNAVASMRERLLWSMQTKGLKTARGGLYPCSVAMRKSVTLLDDQIPEDLRGELIAKGWLTFTEKLDKASIKKEYAESEFVLIEEKPSLSLR